MTDRVVRLKVLQEPAPRKTVLHAPPVIAVTHGTNDYVCGSCETLLVRAEADQVHGFVVQCTACGSYNELET